MVEKAFQTLQTRGEKKPKKSHNAGLLVRATERFMSRPRSFAAGRYVRPDKIWKKRLRRLWQVIYARYYLSTILAKDFTDAAAVP